MKVSGAVARMRIEVEVDCSGSWGGDCSVDQVWKQGQDTGLGFLSRLFHEHGDGKVHIIGKPEMLCVVTPRK
jgi:hypothetical protein